VLRWAEEKPQELRLEEIGETYGRYRLHVPELERGMMRSLESYGQLSPIVVFLHEGRWELLDGFKRLGAARKLQSMERLVARRIEADERAAKAAIYGLNRAGGRTREIEEAWIVHALDREAWAGSARRTPSGIVDPNGRTATGAVARGQPSRHSGTGPA